MQISWKILNGVNNALIIYTAKGDYNQNTATQLYAAP